MELKLRLKVNGMPFRSLLIVPYGIETTDAKLQLEAISLLIVPYGIETYKQNMDGTSGDTAFNRTLWN